MASIGKYQRITKTILSMEGMLKSLTDVQLRGKTDEFRNRLKNGETLEQILPEAFAVVREASKRVTGMKHYPVQIIGGIVLHEGNIAEMKTGEGKTLVATLPSYLNALEGKGVHVVTVNDYLAKRDAELMGKIHEFLGLQVGVILNDMGNAQRKKAYQCDITYVTNNELGFDYLRDNMVTSLGDRVQRGLHYAIIDEVDSILIDEARTPLIISQKGQEATDIYGASNRFARKLKRGEKEQEKWGNGEESGDYIVDEKDKNVYLTESGVAKAEKFFNVKNLADLSNADLQHGIIMALKANALMTRDKDYVVKDNEIMIVDEFTGRILAGRRFSDGLHQAIEAKEHVEIKTENITMATITFQHFFNKYDKKSGMTGTAATEEKEFKDIYHMDVVEIPTNKPVIRKDEEDLVYLTKDEKYHAVLQKIKEIHKSGRPVLVGTASIDVSEYLSDRLKQEGIPHEVLNAKYHEREAEIVSHAGEKGSVTIATNMAGRGTDIKLDPEVKSLGGLYIIGTERHESRRIDNQLRGRAGRQGDPGGSRFYLSLEDDLMRLYGQDHMIEILKNLGAKKNQPLKHRGLSKAISTAQHRIEGNNYNIRKQLIGFDTVNNEQRELVYAERDSILNGEDQKETILRMADTAISELIEEIGVSSKKQLDLQLRLFLGNMSIPDTKKKEEILKSLHDQIERRYENIEKSFPIPGLMNSIARSVFLKALDREWIYHIDSLEHLKEGIRLQSYGQRDPEVEYKMEAYEMFEEMIRRVRNTVVRAVLNMAIIPVGNSNQESESVRKETPIIVRKASMVVDER